MTPLQGSNNLDFNTYQVGDKSYYSRRTIKAFVIQASDHMLFWSTQAFPQKKAELWFEYAEGPKSDHYQQIMHKFSSLRNKAKTSLSSKQIKKVTDLLSSTVSYTCRSNQKDDILKSFNSINEYIEEEQQKRNKLKYFFFVVVIDPILIIAISAAAWAFVNSKIALRAGIDSNFVGVGFCGMIGAYLTVLLRNTEQSAASLNSSIELILYSINKIILGFISGVLVLMIVGNIIIKVTKNDAGPLFGIAAVAGFSEYFIPNIIRILRTKLARLWERTQ